MKVSSLETSHPVYKLFEDFRGSVFREGEVPTGSSVQGQPPYNLDKERVTSFTLTASPSMGLSFRELPNPGAHSGPPRNTNSLCNISLI